MAKTTQTKKKVKFYVIEDTKFKAIETEVEKYYLLLTESIRNNIPKDNDWIDKPITELIFSYNNIVVLKDLLDSIRSDDSKEMEMYKKANNINGVVLSESNLQMLQSLYMDIDEMSESLLKSNISLSLN